MKKYIVYVVLFLFSLLVFSPMLEVGIPPGVDTPAHLHKIWFLEKYFEEHHKFPTWDNYWYGGFTVFKHYPPISYYAGFIMSFFIDYIIGYKLLLFLSYIISALILYHLALKIGLEENYSFLSGFFLLASYPIISNFGIWGRFPTAIALPFMLLTLLFLEYYKEFKQKRFIWYAGLCFGLLLLTHHLTAYATAMVIGIYWITHLYYSDINKFKFTRNIIYIVAIGFIISSWYMVPFILDINETGFERDVDGGWFFLKEYFFKDIFNRNTINDYVYPSYIGGSQIFLGLMGVFYLIRKSRENVYIWWSFLAMFGISMGLTNFFFKYIPFHSQIDSARFYVYMAPFLCILASYGVKQIVNFKFFQKNETAKYVLIALILIVTSSVAISSMKQLNSWQPTEDLTAAFQWISEKGKDGRIYGVGFGHWESYLFPTYNNREIVNGWYHEGTKHWKIIKELESMSWFNRINPSRMYEILKQFNGRYVVIYDNWPAQHPLQTRDALDKSPLFTKVFEKDKITIFEVNL